jgi:uncharacterized protein YfaS (alpha-2-macroglobulin family)
MQPHHAMPLKVSGLLIVLLSLCLFSCKDKRKISKVDPEFSKYIDGYTSGVISKRNTIRIQLTSDVSTTHTLNETIKEELFDFSPSVNGKAYWTDERTIEFKPEKDLNPDQLYEVKFYLDKVRKVPSKFSTFIFDVQVIKPSFTVVDNGLRAVNGSKDKMTLSGSVLTADVEESKKIESILKINHQGKSPSIKWQHNEVNKTHNFIIENIERGSTGTPLLLQWDGAPLNISQKDKRDIAVPAVGDFKVLGVRAVQEEEEFVLVQFSDPLANNQDLKGLIAVSEQQDMSYSINGSEAKVYIANKLDGSYTVNINEGITNEWGSRLNKTFTSNVFFENRLPSVKIHGRGTILPNSGGKLVLPFEATNLKAIDVSIIKIYENNISQFLQTNDLNGEGDIRRVAKPLVRATIKLDDDQSLNLHKKNRFSLDIDKYMRTEPGAIYRVHIGFRPEYSLYTCTKSVDKNEENENGRYYDEYGEGETQNGVDEDDEFWSRYDTYYPYGYNWEQRDNPCSKSYFNKERFASRNIIATNIGLTAKKGTNNTLVVAATNIISTEPMAGVDVEVLDYQRQIIVKGKTGSDGIATLEIKHKPFLLIAKNGEEKSYLKLDDGSALPLSRFEVSGAEVKNGIKGFIFGERGVWRPGDSLYLSCIIEDKQNKLPEDHPVEMELYAPSGQLYKRLVQTNPEDGFNVFRTATDAAAPTGNWNCKVKVGGAVFEKKLKIETVMPNRLKIDLNFGDNPILGKGSTTTGTLSAKWLFGATAKSLKARVDASLYKSKTSFPKYEAYTFDNPTASFEPQTKTIFDGALSETGTAIINPNFQITTQAPGVLTANLMVKVFEPGGNFSIDNVSYPYHPYVSYVGIKVPEGQKPWGYLAAGETHAIDIVNVDTKGAVLPGSSLAEVELYKVQWRWWWDNSGEDLSNFSQDQYNKLLKKETIALSNGKASYKLKIPSENWGRYLMLVRDKISGHVTGQTFYVDDPYWQRRDNKDDPTAASMLSFTSNKEKYNVGEEVKLSIPSSKGGRALISIESGSTVIKTYWTETQQGQTTFSFKAEKEMAPNVYVNVSLLQPHAQTINDLPIRMYGVVPVLVEDKNTILKPVIKMADVIKPEQPTSITVSEAGGNDMSYVIAIVDEGLLDLTRFKTPDPHKAFYAKEALGVKSWDLFDYVIGAWSGDLERILTIGGDSEAEGPGKKKANRFKPIVQFMGPFKSGGGNKTHTFTLPPYMGSVRAMVIAAKDGAYGFAEKAVAVKKPLMLLGTIPRVLGPTEQVRIPVTVFATEKNIRNVTLSLQANNLIEPATTNNQNISFATTGEQQVYFDARVKAATGIGKIKLIATSGKERAEYEVELDVRNPNPPITNITEQTLQPGQSFNSTVAAIGTGGSSKAVVEISSKPAINLERRLQYLIQYPHGCIEQTTSSVFPQLVLNQLMELNEQQKYQVNANVRKGIEVLKNFQTKEGGFAYWPDEGIADEWGTNYAGHFLLEASDRGYNVPSSLMQPWRSYQRSKANAWNETTPVYYGGDLVQSYRLYLLALAKAPELGAMNRLKEYRFITPEAKWRLAAAYYLVGQTGVALQLISGLPTNFSQRTSPGITFGSQLRDQAMVLETLTLMGRKADGERLVRAVAQQLSQESWYSTQTTAYALIAVAKFCGKNASGNKLMVNGNVSGQNINLNSNATLSQTNIAFKNNRANVSLINKGSNVLYVRIINQGQPVTGENIKYNNNPNVLTMSVSFLSSTGAPVDPSSLMQGTDFVAKVTIKNTGQRGSYDQMALSQIFPGGWEILNTRLYNAEGAFKSSPSDYMDIRDDRVYHYFSARQNETLTYYVQLNAAYPGKFYWPGVYCEAMYDNTISAGVNGKWIEVKQ